MGVAYKIMFIVGILYTFVSFVIGSLSGALHLGSHVGHMHTHIEGYGDTSGHLESHTVDANSNHSHIGDHSGYTHTFLSWLGVLINPMVAVSFLTVFGGLGILGTDYFKWIASIVFFISLSAGIIVAFILRKFVVIPLYKSENSTDVPREALVNTTAEVISDIKENGFGEIRYTVNSIRYTAPAKHIKGSPIKQGERVLIYKIENSIFYVVEMDQI